VLWSDSWRKYAPSPSVVIVDAACMSADKRHEVIRPAKLSTRKIRWTKSTTVLLTRTLSHTSAHEHANDIISSAGIFFPRDATRKRGLCCRPVSVRLSVCLTRWWNISARLKILSNFFLGPVAPSFYFSPQRSSAIHGKSLQRGPQIHGVVKFVNFDWNHRLSRKRSEICPWLLCNINRKL